jgi:hypothetical protein
LIFFTGGRFWKLTEGTLKIVRKMLPQEGTHVCIWGGLVIRGPRYELYLTRFWKCLACADFIKDLIWRVQLLNANVFFSCSLWKTWKMPYGIKNNIFHKLQEKNTLAFSNWTLQIKSLMKSAHAKHFHKLVRCNSYLGPLITSPPQITMFTLYVIHALSTGTFALEMKVLA